MRGNGLEFRAHVTLGQGVDPRRFDARASATDPLGRLLVRTFNEPASVPVVVLADLSASMGFRGRVRKIDLLADFTASLGLSAYRSGDPFAFIGFDTAVRTEFVEPLRRAAATGAVLAKRIRAFEPKGTGARGLLQAIGALSQRRSLVFLASDFYFDAALLDEGLAALSSHAVIPLLLVDTREYQSPPRFGLARLVDAETGARRTVLFRPSFNARVRASIERHQRDVHDVLGKHQLRPLWIRDRFVADDVTQYFLGT